MNITLINEHQVVDPTFFINRSIVISGYIHEVLVTPRSNVLGAMNGLKLTARGIYYYDDDMLSGMQCTINMIYYRLV